MNRTQHTNPLYHLLLAAVAAIVSLAYIFRVPVVRKTKVHVTSLFRLTLKHSLIMLTFISGLSFAEACYLKGLMPYHTPTEEIELQSFSSGFQESLPEAELAPGRGNGPIAMLITNIHKNHRK